MNPYIPIYLSIYLSIACYLTTVLTTMVGLSNVSKLPDFSSSAYLPNIYTIWFLITLNNDFDFFFWSVFVLYMFPVYILHNNKLYVIDSVLIIHLLLSISLSIYIWWSQIKSSSYHNGNQTKKRGHHNRNNDCNYTLKHTHTHAKYWPTSAMSAIKCMKLTN